MPTTKARPDKGGHAKYKLADYFRDKYPSPGRNMQRENQAAAVRIFLEFTAPRDCIGQFTTPDLDRYRDWLVSVRGNAPTVAAAWSRTIARVLHHAFPKRFDDPPETHRLRRPAAGPIVDCSGMGITADKYAWHVLPKDCEGTCPICGIQSHGLRRHRAVKPEEKIDAQWLVKRKIGKAWSHIVIGAKSVVAPPPPSVDEIGRPQQRAAAGTLIDSAERYFREREISDHAEYQIRLSVNRFSDSLGRPAVLADLTDEKLNAFVSVYDDGSRSKFTVKGIRANLITVWRAAFQRGEVLLAPQRVRRVKLPTRIVKAWTLDDVRNLLDMAAKLVGTFKRSKVSRPLFWRAFILAGYDTGLRLGDLFALKLSDISPTGRVVIIQHKTNHPIVCQLRSVTVNAIRDTFPPERELIFGEVIDLSRHFHAQWKELATAAGLEGSTRFLRKTGATACEADSPGSAMAFLGHRTPGLSYKHYVDMSQVQTAKPQAPALFECESELFAEATA